MKRGSVGREGCRRNMEKEGHQSFEEGRTVGAEGGEWVEGRLVKVAF